MSINPSDILKKAVSIQPNAWSKLTGEMPIRDVLNWIETGKYQSEINILRRYFESGDLDRYEMYKKRLPGVTFSATFKESRRRDNLKEYNELLVIDIDNLDPHEMTRIRDLLFNDKYVLTFWISPSMRGIKGLIKLTYDFPVGMEESYSNHKFAFDKVRQYYSDTYNIELDKSGSDITSAPQTIIC